MPLSILALMGVKLTGPSKGEIAYLEASDQKVIDQAVNYIAESAHWWHPPENKTYAPGMIEYDYILGLLRNSMCFLFSVRTYWDEDWTAGNLTKLAQAWTKATGRFPPPVFCENWPR